MADSGHPLYGKKKKRLKSCANPLFVQWLTEWRDEAAEKGIKSQYTYGKALATLKKFPLKLETGKDCKILENFGDKICTLLDDKLVKHIAEHGTTDIYNPDHSTSTSASTHRPDVKSTVKQSNTSVTSNSRVRKLSDSAGNHSSSLVKSHSRVHELSDSDEEPVKPPPKKRQKSGERGEREYIPVYRSGPYAMLLTLYKDTQNPNSRGFMTKADLVRLAQPLADKSFTIPDPGCRYTAWSAMGTLIKKGLVIKESSPARYSLTDTGCELAHKLEAVEMDSPRDDVPFRICTPPTAPRAGHTLPAQTVAGQTLPPALPSLPSMPQEDDPKSVHLVGGDNLVYEESAGVGGLGIQTGNRLRFWYITDEGEEVVEKDRAMVTIDDEIGVGFLVKCNYSELLKTGILYKLDTSRPLGDDYVHVYLRNEDAEDVARVPDIVPKRKGSSREPSKAKKTENSRKPVRQRTQELLPLIEASDRVSNNHTTVDDASDRRINNGAVTISDTDESSLDSLPSIKISSRQHVEKVETSAIKYSNNSSTECDLIGMNLKERIKYRAQFEPNGMNLSILDRHQNRGPDVKIRNEQVLPVYNGNSFEANSQRNLNPDSQESSQNSIQSLSSAGSAACIEDQAGADFVLMPGQFDIVLCVDNAEFYGASRGSSKTLLPDLIKNGVETDLRKLHVGDLLWIARERVKAQPGVLERPKGRELVLHYIIERKRMDDLVSSCIDGRFKEQKFRLKKCGLQHPNYLIEDYGSMQHFSIPEDRIKQTIVNTQVIDGFQVKRTKDSKETVAYLTVLTRYLQSNFQNKTLYASSLDSLKESSIGAKISDSQLRLPTFEEFNQGSVKTKALTVREMLGKQLIQLYGMSADKAKAVTDKYPTPSRLFKAFEMCTTEKDKESLLSSIKCGKSLRSLGLSQSKQISELYNTTTALR